MFKVLMTNRSRVLLGLAGAAAVGLAGCNGSGNGGPTAQPTATPLTTGTPVATAVPTASATPIGNPFRAQYTGTYRTLTPATGEIGTLLFTVGADGTASGFFSSPLAPDTIPIRGTVSNAGVLHGSGTADFGGQASRVTVDGTLSRGADRLFSGTGTFTNAYTNSTVRGTIAARSLAASQVALFNGSYTGTFVNKVNTSQNGTVKATVNNGNVTAAIDVPGIGTINGRGILDFSTGRLTLSAPFRYQNTAQFFGLNGRVVRAAGNAVVGAGTFTSSAGGRGTFRITKDSNR